jgi:hypothetical protein
MITCKLALCAETTVRDAQNNLVSIFNIIEDIVSQSFPLAIPKISCFFLVVREDNDPESEEFSLRFTIDNEETNRFPVQGNFQGKLRNRITTVVHGLLVPRPGCFSASLWLSEDKLGQWDINVKQIGNPEIKATEG